MATAAELAIVLKAKDEASAVLKKVSAETANLGKAGDTANKGLGSLAAGFKGAVAAAAGIAVAVGGVTALTAAVGNAVGSAIDFEKSMSGIKAVSGATGQQMQQLSTLALELGKATSFSAQEAAGGIEELVKGGVSIGDIFGGAAASALDLAAAGGVSVGEAATIAANAMNQFNLRGSDMSHVADLVAGAANASSISVSDFNQSLAAGGAVAALAGQSIDSFATAVALMGAQGIKGSDAGTSLKSAINSLIPTTDTAKKAMMDLGIITADGANQFIDSSGKMKDFGSIAEILQTQTEGLTESQKLLSLELIFGSDGMRAAGVLAKQGGEGFDAMSASMQAAGSAADIARERLNNAAGDIEQLKGSLETAAITVGTLFLPAIRSIAQGATAAVNTAVDEFNTLRATTENIAGAHGLGLIPAALTAIELRIGEVFGSQAQSAFHGARQAAEDLGAAFDTTKRSAETWADVNRSRLAPSIDQIRDSASGAAPVVAELGNAFGATGRVVEPLTRQFADFLVQQGLVSSGTAKLTGQQQQAAAVADLLFALYRNTPLGQAQSAFNDLAAAIQHAQSATGEAATATDAAWQGFIAGAGAVRDQVVAKLGELTAFISSLPGRFAEDGAAAGLALVTGIVTNLSPTALVQACLTMIGAAIDGARGAAAAQSPSVGVAIAQGMAGGIAGGAAGVVNAAVGLATRAIAAARAALDSHSPSKEFEAIGEDVDAGFIAGVEGMASEVEGAVAGLMEGATQTAVDAFAGLADALGAAAPTALAPVERAEQEFRDKREDAERKHQRRMVDLEAELGAAQGKARADVQKRMESEEEDFNNRLEDLTRSRGDRVVDLERDQARTRAEAVRDFQRGAEDVQRTLDEGLAASARKAGQAVSDAMRDAADSIIETRDRTAAAIADLQANQTLDRGIRSSRDTFTAGQDQQSLERDRAQETADAEYRLKKDLEEAKYKLGKDRAKAETEEERRQADIRYAESVDDIRKSFDDAKTDLARRRQIEDDNRAYRKQQQQALQAFNDSLEDAALQRQVKRLQDERDTRIKEIGAALDDKIAKVRQNEKDENEALRKSADEKLTDLRERFYDKVGALNEDSRTKFEALFSSIKKGADDAAAAANKLADAINKASSAKAPTLTNAASAGQSTWENQPQSVRDMFIATWGAADAKRIWQEEHAAELGVAVGTTTSSGGGGGGGSAPSQTSDVHAAGFDWAAYNAANQGKPRNPDGTVKSAYGNPLSAGQASWVGETGPEMFVPATAGRLMTTNQIESAVTGGQHGGGGGGYWEHTHAIYLDGRLVGEALEPEITGAQTRSARLVLG